MKAIHSFWAVVLTLFAFACFYFYFTIFYWHLALFGLMSAFMAYVFISEMVDDYKKAKRHEN